MEYDGKSGLETHGCDSLSFPVTHREQHRSGGRAGGCDAAGASNCTECDDGVARENLCLLTEYIHDVAFPKQVGDGVVGKPDRHESCLTVTAQCGRKPRGQ